MPQVVVALGSNVGNPLRHLQAATAILRERFELLATSRVYRTEPMYVVDQPSFLNAAVLLRTDLGPLPMLQELKAIESEIGRRQSNRYGPREIDLDLISFGSLKYRYRSDGREVLQVPHPRIPERRFVLAPLYDVAPDYRPPGMPSVRSMLDQTNDQAGSVLEVGDAFL
ncbi:MAG TPA: 2-amino-4-hydroxy-6-hydroxymethyldihydropteridine diphosphokinase [Fimbriimonas sp.]